MAHRVGMPLGLPPQPPASRFALRALSFSFSRLDVASSSLFFFSSSSTLFFFTLPDGPSSPVLLSPTGHDLPTSSQPPLSGEQRAPRHAGPF